MKTLFAAVFLLFGVAAYANAAGAPSTAVPKFNHQLPTVPGKSLVAVEVTLPPGAKSAPHRHADSAFILAYVLSGSVKSQVEGEPERIFKEGESWYENPRAHHLFTQNMSDTTPAKFLAVFVVDTNDKVLTRPDAAK